MSISKASCRPANGPGRMVWSGRRWKLWEMICGCLVGGARRGGEHRDGDGEQHEAASSPVKKRYQVLEFEDDAIPF